MQQVQVHIALAHAWKTGARMNPDVVHKKKKVAAIWKLIWNGE
jgi:hypothetical protein